MIGQHDAAVEQDFDGWCMAECSCGWVDGPFPGREDAYDAIGDHRVHESHRTHQEDGE